MNNKDYLNGYLLLKEYGFSYEEVVKIIDVSSFDKVDNDKLIEILDHGCKYFIDKGYNLFELRKMVVLCPRCLTISDNKRKMVEDTFSLIDMSFQDFKCMSMKCVNIYSYSKERIVGYINFFKNLGYDNEDIVNIFTKTLSIFRSSVANLEKLYDELLEFGFTREELVRIGRSCPSFWAHNINKFKGIIDVFMSFGFNRDEAIYVLKVSPSLIGYGDDTIICKYNSLLGLGFNKDCLNYIILKYPSIINGDIDRINGILQFFISIDLYDKLIEEPKGFFIQALDVSYSRYQFYKDRGIEINSDNYSRLFVGWKKFEKIYGLNKEELLDIYIGKERSKVKVRKK